MQATMRASPHLAPATRRAWHGNKDNTPRGALPAAPRFAVVSGPPRKNNLRDTNFDARAKDASLWTTCHPVGVHRDAREQVRSGPAISREGRTLEPCGPLTARPSTWRHRLVCAPTPIPPQPRPRNGCANSYSRAAASAARRPPGRARLGCWAAQDVNPGVGAGPGPPGVRSESLGDSHHRQEGARGSGVGERRSPRRRCSGGGRCRL